MTEPAGISRRRLLGAGAAIVGGTGLVGASVGRASVAGAGQPDRDGEPSKPAEVATGAETIPFHGTHQAGVETPAQAFATYVALDLQPGVDTDGLRRLLTLLTDDARRLTAGRGALADDEPELAADPARLSVTFGLGPSVFDRYGLADRRPSGLVDLPPFPIDRLEDRWSGGDLLLHVGGDDPVSMAHCLRMLLKDARAFATLRWSQRGFRHARGVRATGATPRNLLGQVDGTTNPRPGTPDFARVVWDDSPTWFAGGTTLVLRRIRMELDSWEQVSRGERALVVGRRLDTGAPLSGGTERDPVDRSATGADGLPLVPEFAHAARAGARTSDERFLRRGYSYDDAPEAGSGRLSETGLIFCAYQADVGRQFVPVQRRLADGDALNEWITPIGSAVFAIPPGCGPDGFVGEGLLS